MSVINVHKLTKVYSVAVKDPGWQGAITHFLKRNYRYVTAVQDISFEIGAGEIVGFLGPNGAGKTTTLKILTGLIHPSGGDVTVAGFIPFRREASFLQGITLVMGQKQQLIWDLPALDSLRINAAVYGIADFDFQNRLQELTGLLDLEGKLDKPVRKLSLGERMKAELMAALLHRPQILFLDEPTLGLDVNAQVSVRQFLKEYNQRYGSTILLTSHYMADITALCDRVLVIHQGQLIYDGQLEKLLERFAPYREVKLDLARPYARESFLPYGELCQDEAFEKTQTVRLMIQKDSLAKRVTQLLSDLDVLDLMVTDPPIEEVVGRIFSTGSTEESSRVLGE